VRKQPISCHSAAAPQQNTPPGIGQRTYALHTIRKYTTFPANAVAKAVASGGSETMGKRWINASAQGIGLLSAMAAGAQTVPATKQPASGAPGKPAQVEQVIVTAQRRSERLSRIGVTVTAIGSKELSQRGVESPKDLVKVVPGFQATQSFNGNPVYTLRGVGFDSTNTYSTSPVGIYVDQAAIPYPAMSTGLLFDLARVEVLKGPQGTLYGRNATGGLVDYVTIMPTDNFHAGMTTEFGNFGTINSTAYVSGQVANGLDMRLAGNTQNRLDGWQQSVTRNETLGVFNQDAFRFTTVFDQGGAFTANLQVSYWKKQGDAQAPQSIFYIPGNSPFAPPGVHASVIANPTSDTQADWLSSSNQPEANIGIYHAPPQVDTDFVSATLKADYRISDLVKLESLTSFDHLNDREAADLAGLAEEANFQDVDTLINSFNQELRLLGSYGDLNWSAGAYYANDTSIDHELGYNDQNNTVNTLRYLASTLPQTTYSLYQIENSFGNYVDRSGSDTNVQAVFANADYKINSQFKATAGVRFTQDSESTTACTYDYMGHNVPIINLIYPLLFGRPYDAQPGKCYTLQANGINFVDGSVHEHQTQTNVAWHVNLDYTPTEWALIYASISRGFKAGGFPLLAASNEKQFDPVSQEQLTSYELGDKLRLFDGTVQLNTSAFYYDYVNKQVLGRVADPVFSTLVRIENIPKSYIYGIEGDLTWRVTNTLTTSVSGIYEQSDIVRYVNYDEFSQLLNFKGKPFAYTPKVQLNGIANYEVPLTDALHFTASVAVSYQSDTNGSFADLPIFDVKAHTIVDGTIGVAGADGKWRFDLYAKNLFDTYYWTGVTSATDSVFRYAGLPRQFGGRLTYNF
jgi:outer membrane receptor protein involved in Fe transport